MKRRRLLSLPIALPLALPISLPSALAVALTTAAGAAHAAAAGIVRTRIDTELGAFVVEVDEAVAPTTVANYLAYVDRKLLDRAVVYRVVTLANQAPATRHKIEVVQWGLDPNDDTPPPLPPIAHETTRQTGLRHLDGTLSMARSQVGTASSEFFICLGDQPELDFGGGRNPDGQGFAAFGRVVSGMDVVRALHARGEAEQRVTQPIRIRSVRRVD